MEEKKMDMDLLGKQLRCPEGETGKEVAKRMNTSNQDMIENCIQALEIKDDDNILELGPGNGLHVNELLDLANNISFTGLDISEGMVEEAKNLVTSEKTAFQHFDGTNIPFEANSFDKIFTVNTIYFWEQPEKYAAEIKRVLKPKGIFTIAFADSSFMKDLPFIAQGFELYDEEKASTLFKSVDLDIVTVSHKSDIAISKTGDKVNRKYLVFQIAKPE
ncbi:MAG: SAM-dependent methyltransferase [Thalassobius sp.]|nr:SAM-dependent methyltransferase [Thalassovita sp.]